MEKMEYLLIHNAPFSIEITLEDQPEFRIHFSVEEVYLGRKTKILIDTLFYKKLQDAVNEAYEIATYQKEDNKK